MRCPCLSVCDGRRIRVAPWQHPPSSSRQALHMLDAHVAGRHDMHDAHAPPLLTQACTCCARQAGNSTPTLLSPAAAAATAAAAALGGHPHAAAAAAAAAALGPLASYPHGDQVPPGPPTVALALPATHVMANPRGLDLGLQPMPPKSVLLEAFKRDGGGGGRRRPPQCSPCHPAACNAEAGQRSLHHHPVLAPPHLSPPARLSKYTAIRKRGWGGRPPKRTARASCASSLTVKASRSALTHTSPISPPPQHRPASHPSASLHGRRLHSRQRRHLGPVAHGCHLTPHTHARAGRLRPHRTRHPHPHPHQHQQEGRTRPVRPHPSGARGGAGAGAAGAAVARG